VLVEYLVAKDRSFAFVVSGSGTKVVPLAIGRDGLRQQVRKLLLPFRQLRAGELDLARLTYDTRAAFALHQAIFAPVRMALGASTDIVIVPDDVLTFLPFEALVEQAPRGGPRGRILHEEFAGERYLLNRYAISYLPSSAQLLARAADTAAPRQTPKRFFALANPAAGRPAAPASSQDDPLRRQLRSGTFDAFLTPLPGAEAEVERIVRHFPGDASAIVTGGGATEAAYESQAGQYGIVHFATHAVASDGQPFYSTLILAPDSAPGHDGFLQAFEVLRTPLQANLVVLSGCETAMGAEDLGQGLVGLVAAFQQAGARSVLATLWSIDEATAEVMAGFYDAMATGASTPAALRQAKLQMLKQRLRIGQTDVSLAHPFFWAPFILIGAR
jgi:CHAT domain-containing protein